MNLAKKICITIIFFLTAAMSSACFGADIFDLSYSLTEGGYQLTFDSYSLYKGVNVKVDSNISTRYEIVQRIIQPLASREDPNLTIQDNFVVRGISGSNKTGNFRFSTAEVPVRTEDIIYTSDVSGSQDSFSLVYGLIKTEQLKPGSYAGRISFTLNPIGSSKQQVTKILEVNVSITDQGQQRPLVEISTSSGSNFVTLNSNKDRNQLSAEVSFKINSSSGKQFSIIQVLNDPFESEEGNLLDNNSVTFIVKNSKVLPLATGSEYIYTSDMAGASENFTVTYALGDLSGKKAGRYKSRIQYFWEEQGIKTKLDTLEFVVENEKIFDLVVLPQDQKYAVEFRDIKPQGPAKRSEVALEVRNNTGRPYQINQEISSALVNKAGNEISSKFFNFYTEDIDSKGSLNFLKKQEAKKGNSILFVSDDKGTPSKIKAVYELSVPLEIKPGDYSADITYSLLEK